MFAVGGDHRRAMVVPARRACRLPPRRGGRARRAGASASSMTARPSASEVVMRAAGEVGPCSAWPKIGGDERGSAESPAITATSEGRRAVRSRRERTAGAWPRRRMRCPGRRSCRRSGSSGTTPSRAVEQAEYHRRQRTSTPPSAEVQSAPRGGDPVRGQGVQVTGAAASEHAITVSTPATLGTSTVMNAQASIGHAAAGAVGADRRRPAPGAGPGRRPGSVSASKSVSVARCSWAKLRIWAWAKAMLSFSASGSDAVAAATWSAPTSKLGGSQSIELSRSTRGRRRCRRARSPQQHLGYALASRRDRVPPAPAVAG